MPPGTRFGSSAPTARLGPLPRTRSLRARSTACAMALACLALVPSTGCSTRSVDDRIINRYGLDVYLRTEKKLFGGTIEEGYAQPSEISEQRLKIILASLEIERREGARSVLGPAIPAEILDPVAEGLAQAFREANSSQRIVVSAERKQMQKAIFNRKFLTSFVTWIEGDDLVFHLSRADWPIDDKRQSGLPKPHANDPQQRFRLVTNELVRRSGKTGVAVDWRSEAFRTFTSASLARTAPVSAAGPAQSSGAGSKTVLMESPETDAVLPEPLPLTGEQLESLSPQDLRALADLEEERDAGRITEDEYRRNRARLLETIDAP